MFERRSFSERLRFRIRALLSPVAFFFSVRKSFIWFCMPERRRLALRSLSL